ncbi:hypothetical protein JCM10212_005098 [Sporobolomyces blumeae]
MASYSHHSDTVSPLDVVAACLEVESRIHTIDRLVTVIFGGLVSAYLWRQHIVQGSDSVERWTEEARASDTAQLPLLHTQVESVERATRSLMETRHSLVEPVINLTLHRPNRDYVPLLSQVFEPRSAEDDVQTSSDSEEAGSNKSSKVPSVVVYRLATRNHGNVDIKFRVMVNVTVHQTREIPVDRANLCYVETIEPCPLLAFALEEYCRPHLPSRVRSVARDAIVIFDLFADHLPPSLKTELHLSPQDLERQRSEPMLQRVAKHVNEVIGTMQRSDARTCDRAALTALERFELWLSGYRASSSDESTPTKRYMTSSTPIRAPQVLHVSSGGCREA